MNILIAKTFGIGNAVMAIPMIKAIRQANPEARVDVLVGSTPDDFGAWQVLSSPLVLGLQGKVHVDEVREFRYDVAVLSIPYDGRWHNGVHFFADKVIDGRTRPDPSTMGLVSWKAHEIEYQMENARLLGFSGRETPDCSFDPSGETKFEGRIYLGIGYKKDTAGFWKIKHWGNENYATLVKMLLNYDPAITVTSTGDTMDRVISLNPIRRYVNDKRFRVHDHTDLQSSFDVISSCDMYVGNDTGMMHVAASYDKPTLGLFFLENSITKSRPWGPASQYIDGTRDRSLVTPEVVFERIVRMRS